MAIVLMQLVLFVFPWPIRKLLLKLFFRFSFETGAKIGYSLVLARNCSLGKNAIIGNFNFINRIDRLQLGDNSKIGRYNWITGASVNTNAYINSPIRKCELIIGNHTHIVDRHHIDCNGGVYIGSFSTLAGIHTQILTHSIDIKESVQKTGPVKIGDYCFIGTKSTFLMNAVIPDFSVLGAGSVVTKSFSETFALYAGNPAKFIKYLSKESKYFYRKIGKVY